MLFFLRVPKEAFMDKVKKILAPTDFSDMSKVGVRHALEMASAQGAEIIVYNVVGYEEGPFPPGLEDWVSSHEELPRVQEIVEERKRLLAKFLGENFAGFVSQARIREEVDVGSPYKKIVEKAAEEGVDIIVMSTHGRTGLLHMLVGSVAERVVRLATCPVLTIRPTKENKRAGAAAA